MASSRSLATCLAHFPIWLEHDFLGATLKVAVDELAFLLLGVQKHASDEVPNARMEDQPEIPHKVTDPTP